MVCTAALCFRTAVEMGAEQPFTAEGPFETSKPCAGHEPILNNVCLILSEKIYFVLRLKDNNYYSLITGKIKYLKLYVA